MARISGLGSVHKNCRDMYGPGQSRLYSWTEESLCSVNRMSSGKQLGMVWWLFGFPEITAGEASAGHLQQLLVLRIVVQHASGNH